MFKNTYLFNATNILIVNWLSWQLKNCDIFSVAPSVINENVKKMFCSIVHCGHEIFDTVQSDSIQRWRLSVSKPEFWYFLLRSIVLGTKVTAQLSENLEPPKILCIHVNWHFICSICLKYSGVFFFCHFSTQAVLDFLLSFISLSHNQLLSLILTSTYSPLCFYLSPFNIKGWWFYMIVIIESTNLNEHCFSLGGLHTIFVWQVK
jgi:hypothetical protein